MMFFKIPLFLIFFIFLVNFLAAKNVYVSPNGSHNGTGSKSQPMNLFTALRASKTVSPGDTIFILEGVYKGHFKCTLNGTKEEPIVITSYPNNRVTLDGSITGSQQKEILKVDGNYLIFMDFEITHANPHRQSLNKGSNPKDIQTLNGLSVFGKGNKFINLVIHDVPGNSIGLWKTALNAEVYGCILYYAGWDAPDRGHGYNIYTQNGSPDFYPFEYSAGNIVRYKEEYYVAKKHHGDEIRKWSGGKRYKKGSKVFYKGKLYVNNAAYINAGVKPDESSDWISVKPPSIDSHLPTDSRYWDYMGKEDPAGYKHISNNFIFSSHRTGISCYTENGTIKNYIFEDNIIFDNGQLSKKGRNWNLLAGGLNPADNIYLNHNTFYHNANYKSIPVELGYKNTNGMTVVQKNIFMNNGLFLSKWNKIILTDNIFSGKKLLQLKVNDKNAFSSYLFNNNSYYSFNPQSIKLEGAINGIGDLSLIKNAGVNTQDKISNFSNEENEIKVVPNRYDESRFHITIHNFKKDDSIELEMNKFLTKGKKYRIVDVQNYYGDPIVEDIYDGEPIQLPMTLSEVSVPLGNVSKKPVHTSNELGTFILFLDD